MATGLLHRSEHKVEVNKVTQKRRRVLSDEKKNSHQLSVDSGNKVSGFSVQVSVFRFQDRKYFLTPETRNLG
jgi:hypothetical protein